MPIKQGASRIRPKRDSASRFSPATNSKLHKSTADVAEKKGSSRGASTQKTDFKSRWTAYRSHHSASAKDSLQRMQAAPAQSLITALVLAIALALPAILLVSLDNLKSLGERWDSGPKVSVFLNKQARQSAIDDFKARINQHSLVAEVSFISASQALEDFQKSSGMGAVLQSLGSNPLPPALIIKPISGSTSIQLDEFTDTLKASPLVEDVLFDQYWVQRLNKMLFLGERLVFGLGALLLLGTLLVIGNTMRLAIENRRDEIVIIKLVGGTDAFVKRPFLYTGLWYGLAGGLLALLLINLGLTGLEGPVRDLSSLYGSNYSLHGLSFINSAALLGVAALMGWFGAWLTLGRELGSINPE